MAEQVDGVLNAPGPFQRAAVDSYPQRLRCLLRVEALGLLRHLHGALKQSQIHVRGDESVTELLQAGL